MGYAHTDHTVYVVAWDAAGIFKVGSSHAQRWRKFEIRGARIVRLITYPDVYACYDAESTFHRRFRLVFDRAFSNRHEAQPFLGSGGAGWAECYRETPGQCLEHCLTDCSDLLPAQSTDGRDVLTNGVLPPVDISPVRYAHAGDKAIQP